MTAEQLQVHPVLADLDRWVRSSVDDELSRLTRRAPRLPDHAADELRDSLTRLGDRLLLHPARTYTIRFPERCPLIGALLLDAEQR